MKKMLRVVLYNNLNRDPIVSMIDVEEEYLSVVKPEMYDIKVGEDKIFVTISCSDGYDDLVIELDNINPETVDLEKDIFTDTCNCSIEVIEYPDESEKQDMQNQLKFWDRMLTSSFNYSLFNNNWYYWELTEPMIDETRKAILFIVSPRIYTDIMLDDDINEFDLEEHLTEQEFTNYKKLWDSNYEMFNDYKFIMSKYYDNYTGRLYKLFDHLCMECAWRSAGCEF